MQVYQGRYHHWFQPYRWLKDWAMWWNGVHGEKDKFDLGRYEAVEKRIRDNRFARWLRDVEHFVDARHTRKIRVKIDYWDVWGADHTLAVIIVPLLKLLKEKKQGSPFVDDDDVPEHLCSTACPPVGEYETDANHHARWEWVLDEMIWAMEQVADESGDDEFFDHSNVNDSDSFSAQVKQMKFDKKGYDKYQHRVARGLKLFGKYFRALWD
jgi:hypothetical protein